MRKHSMNLKWGTTRSLSLLVSKMRCGRGDGNVPTLSRNMPPNRQGDMGHTARLAALLPLALGCSANDRSSSSAADSARGGTVVIAVGGDPDGLFPPVLSTTTGRAVTEQVYDHLADLGSDLNTVGDAGFSPRLAKSWRWSADSLSIAFHLDPQARWHDGAPVRASDVAFTYRIYSDTANGSPFSTALEGIDSVTATDSLTATIWYKTRSPMQFYDAVNTMLILPEHIVGNKSGTALRESSVARNPVGTGRFRFAKWNAAQSIEL